MALRSQGIPDAALDRALHGAGIEAEQHAETGRLEPNGKITLFRRRAGAVRVALPVRLTTTGDPFAQGARHEGQPGSPADTRWVGAVHHDRECRHP